MALRPVERLLQLSGSILEHAGLLNSINRALHSRGYKDIPVVRPEIIRTLPHDTRAFTQGLAYGAGGRLFESTGLYSESSLRELDTKTGEVLRIVSIEDDFAEDCTLVDDMLFLLSWKSGRVRVFNVMNFEIQREICFAGEAWGLAALEDGFLVSDGSCRLWICDNDFQQKRKLFVTSRGVPFRHLNALEKAPGRIYANMLGSYDIIEMLDSGKILRIVDCRELAKIEGAEHPEHVLNGIAWQPENKHFYVTGKCWKNLFEIRLPS